jgi:uncharacterized protein
MGTAALPGLVDTLWRTAMRSALRTVVRWGLIGLSSATVLVPAYAQPLQAIPTLTSRVIDQTATLSAGQQGALEAKLQAFEQSQGTQIVVLMVRTTAPEDITDYTQRVGEAWKIGRKEVGDGLLLVIAKDDRTLRIAPAKALEGAVPDLAARQVIDRVIVPRLREGDFAGGISAGLDQLMARISGEALPTAQEGGSKSVAQMEWNTLLVLLFIAVPGLARLLAGGLGRKPAALLTGIGAGLLAWSLGAGLLLSLLAVPVAALWGLIATLAHWRIDRTRGGWGGPGGSSWSSGGFRSGGGGDFGGGGASGRW